MPRLNADILFDVGKQLIQDGNSAAALRFALSGKESFEAMKRVFASASTLKLYNGYFFVGWENKCCKFGRKRSKPIPKFLMNQIGNRVTKLRIGCKNIEFYQAIIDTIIEKKKLISFSAGRNCCQEFLDQFLPIFATTLKAVTIPNQKMTETFRDTFNLESLIVLDYEGYVFPQMCCKTEQLEIRRPPNFISFFSLIISGNNQHRSSVKRLIYNRNGASTFYEDFNLFMNHFCSLEVLHYNFTYCGLPSQYESFIQHVLIRFALFFLHDVDKVPFKVVFTFKMKKEEANLIQGLDFYKQICRSYQLDESVKDYYCFFKTLESADQTKSTIFELQFSK